MADASSPLMIPKDTRAKRMVETAPRMVVFQFLRLKNLNMVLGFGGL